MPDFEESFQRYHNDVYRLAISYTRNVQEAEDVCQTVFLKLLEAKQITPGKEKAWLLQVTANQCRSILRSAWWRKTEALDDTIPAAAPSFDTRHAVMQLKPKYRVVIYLHYYECYTTREIASLLKISQTAVTTRLARAREQLKQMLQED